MMDGGRERILGAAAGLFTRLGYAAVSIRDIAEAAGLSKPGIYHHFGSKEELLLEILERELLAEEPLLAALGDRSRPWRARLVDWVAAVLALPSERSLVVLRLGQELERLDEARRLAFSMGYRARFLAPLKAFLEEGVAAGELRPEAGEPGLWILLGTLTPFLQGAGGRAGAGAGEGGTEPAASLAERLVGLLLGGLGS